MNKSKQHVCGAQQQQQQQRQRHQAAAPCLQLAAVELDEAAVWEEELGADAGGVQQRRALEVGLQAGGWVGGWVGDGSGGDEGEVWL